MNKLDAIIFLQAQGYEACVQDNVVMVQLKCTEKAFEREFKKLGNELKKNGYNKSYGARRVSA